MPTPAHLFQYSQMLVFVKNCVFFSLGGVDVDLRHNCFIKIQKTQNMNKVGTWLVIIWQAPEAY